MKLSVLLPTRNGARYLRECAGSVLANPREDLELVVSDNASDDGTREILESLSADPRVRVVHQAAPISVTDNWMRTLEAARGDYVLLLGDDDFLLPAAVDRLMSLVDEHGQPDCISFEAYGFAFPDAFSPGSEAHFSDPLFPYSDELPRTGEIPAAARAWAVRDFFRFEFRVCPNLQTTLVSRAALERLPSTPFQAPYPDFYAINALLLTVNLWIHVPEKLAVVGISPKSFGGTLSSGGTEQGRTYLGIQTSFPGYLPGTDMINGMHLTLQNLERDFPGELLGTGISRSNYVYRQIYSWYLGWRLKTIGSSELVRRLRLLSGSDWLGFAREMAGRINLGMISQHARVDDHSAIGSVWPNMRPAAQFTSIAAFAESAAANTLP
ncbi:MAG TPA: glycosyltransferase family A protein [Solirubrobacteraceae bacterium]|jgi:glycosyltransferase involved in cell wall biosynthesis|nr:glycosyltransferase family A protein [Solirubrobacteraceae bacterium]